MTIGAMPTTKQRLQLVLTDEEYNRLLAVYEALQHPDRQSTPHCVPIGQTFNQWSIARLLERAEQVRREAKV